MFPSARINNCLMSSGGWDPNSGHYGCPDPSFILDGCNDVQWSDDGPMGSSRRPFFFARHAIATKGRSHMKNDKEYSDDC